VLSTRHHGELLAEAGAARPWARKDRSDWRFLDMATTNGHTTAVSDLVDSLRRAHQLCDTGDNLPELLREALEQLATEIGGTEQLVRHRPGSWEAVNVRQLAGLLH
jgi:hypothetical protein